MGGKGGGGDSYSPEAAGYVKNPAAAMGNNEPAYMLQSEYDAKYNQPAPLELAAEPDPEPEATPAAEEAAPAAAPAAAAPAIDTALTPPDVVGGGPTPPAAQGTGDALGGAVLKPPRYWTGGLDQYETAHRTGRGNSSSGSMKTTQT